MSTRAVDVSIHAVSPELNLSIDTSAGAVSVETAAGSSAWANGAQNADINRNAFLERVLIDSP
jgi:hypothetical protein